MLPKDTWEMGAGAIPLSLRSRPAGPQPRGRHTFLRHRTSKVRALRAARLERLVRELVSGDPEQDPGFCACLPGHPPGLRAYRPHAGPPPAATGAATPARVSTNGRFSSAHPRLSPGCSIYFSELPPPLPQNPLQPFPSSPDVGVGGCFPG